MEAAFQHGELRGRDDLLAFLEAGLAQCASSAVPFVSAGFDDAQSLLEVDGVCDAFTSNHVANRASRLQGKAFLASSEKAFPEAGLKEVRHELLEQEAATHFAPVFGAVARRLGLRKDEALRLFVFTQVRGWLSSAVRLGIVGPIEAQGLQARLAPEAERTVEGCAGVGLEELAQTAPLIDLFQGTQDRLYSRLFQS
jgi:urease accessory protein